MSFRASGFWDVQGHDEDDEDDMGILRRDEDPEPGLDSVDNDGRTALDKTIDRIGMGSYQWTLLSLCGFGWLADNMWMQAVAIVLPRVQRHYAIPDSYIGILSTSMFAGMMCGAIGWGTCSDLMGRSTAFNATLFFTSVFGILASFANSFVTLCISFFLLGSAVGGSMPTDGTLLLEHMPRGKEYLVTALSVFFSFGAVLAALVALIAIPSNSCPPAPETCDVESQNMGWRYTLMALGLITLSMFLARMVFFRLHESPRYLVHAGRAQEAVEALQLISRFNGSELTLNLRDVDDTHAHDNISPDPSILPQTQSPVDVAYRDHRGSSENAPFLERDAEYGERSPLNPGGSSPSNKLEMLFDAEGVEGEEDMTFSHPRSHKDDIQQDSESRKKGSPVASPTPASAPVAPLNHNGSGNSIPAYSATSESASRLGGFQYQTPIDERPRHDTFATSAPARTESFFTQKPISSPTSEDDEEGLLPPARRRPPLVRPQRTRRSAADLRSSRVSASSFYDSSKRGTLVFGSGEWSEWFCGWWWWRMPRKVRGPVEAWFERFAMVLGPEWVRTTLLVWAAWFGMSLAYTMFNVYLPKFLEARSSSDSNETGQPKKSLEGTLWDVVIFTLGGCPGAVLGAYLVESPLGRRKSLAGSTFVTAVFCMIFVMVDGQVAVTASTVGISLSATAMYAVLYGWTPEIFGTKVRGTACGTASALSRIGGMIAPILGGVLLMIKPSVPVYTSVVVFVLSAACVMFLQEDAGDGMKRKKTKDGPTLVH